MSRAFYRLWGAFDSGRELQAPPRFAADLAVRSRGDVGLRSSKVSGWSLGQHLEHLYRTSLYVLDRVDEAMADDASRERPNLLGRGFLVVGFIPRGVFQAIPEVRPGDGTVEEIEPLCGDLEQRLRAFPWSFAELEAHRGRSRHPRMGAFLALQWLYFLEVHHRHHLVALRRIQQASS